MIHAGRKSRPYGLGCVLGARTLYFFLRAHQLASDGAGGFADSCLVILSETDMTKRKQVKFDLLALTETKLIGEGEVSWVGVNGIISGVQE